MIANFLVKKNNINPCMKVELDMNKGSALCEMTSVEEGSLFLKVECNVFLSLFIYEFNRNKDSWLKL